MARTREREREQKEAWRQIKARGGVICCYCFFLETFERFKSVLRPFAQMSGSSSPSPSGEVPPTVADVANQKGPDGGRLVDNWGEWGKRQALLGRVTAKQQQCQAIDQHRQQACSSPSPSPSAISEECKDLAKMSLACYG